MLENLKFFLDTTAIAYLHALQATRREAFWLYRWANTTPAMNDSGNIAYRIVCRHATLLLY